ncbi:MAG: flagellar hook capping family protein [Alphaproteobacteria bacterium]|nr:flagellar hook capping family protein [Alphaproteobacteria bacterium]
MASDITINNALDFQAQTSRSSAQLAEDFDDFLVLLTTQLQNQDPLSPMDSTEFTNQLVNFAGVEQQINSNQKLDALVANSIGSAFSSALGYVGLDVSYLSSEAFFDGSKPINVNYAIEGDSVDTTINIFDEAGDLVFTQKVSDDDSVEEFTWDGTTNGGSIAPPGTYEIRVGAIDAAGEAIKTSTVVTGHVNGIETQNGTIFLLVGERAVSLGNIINVSQPLEIPATSTPITESTNTEDQQQAT